MSIINIEEGLKPRLKELKSCIYCNEDLPAKSREHIFNSCWGGLHKTGQLICDNCNNDFSKIDGTFDAYTRMIMNAFQFKGQRHKSVPSIETNSPFVIGPGGKPIRESEFEVKKNADGTVTFSMNTKSKSESRKLIQDNKQEIERLLERPLTEEDFEKFYQKIRESEYEKVEVGTLPIELSLNIEDQYRSAGHTILKCLAMFDPDTVLSENLEGLKKFSRYNEGEWRNYAIIAKSLVSIFNNVDQLNVKYNAVEIFYSSSLGKIIGCLKILGRVNRWVLISNEYEGPDKVLFVLENLNGGGKVDGLRWVSKGVPLPIVQIDSNKLTPEYFRSELQKIAVGSISIDAPANELIGGLENYFSKNGLVCEKSNEDIMKLFLDYGQSLLKLFGITNINRVHLEEYLIKMGINKIGEEYTGKSINDSDYQAVMANLYNEFIGYIKLQKSEK